MRFGNSTLVLSKSLLVLLLAGAPLRAQAEWLAIDGALTQISAGSATRVWGVNAGGNIYRRDADYWTQISGSLTNVAAAADGTVVGVNAGGNVYRYNGGGWSQLPGTLSQVTAGSATQVWGVNSAGNTYHWDGNQWVLISSVPRVAISAAADGTVVALDAANQIFRWTGSSWTQIPGALTQVSVVSANEIWGTNAANSVYVWNGANWLAQGAGRSWVSAATDRTAYALDKTGRIYTRLLSLPPVPVQAAPNWMPWKGTQLANMTRFALRVSGRCPDTGSRTGLLGVCAAGERMPPQWLGVDPDGYVNAARNASSVTANPPPADSVFTPSVYNPAGLLPDYTLFELLSHRGHMYLCVASGAKVSAVRYGPLARGDTFALKAMGGNTAGFLALGDVSRVISPGAALPLGIPYDSYSAMNVAATMTTPFDSENRWSYNAGPQRNIVGKFQYNGLYNEGGTYEVYVSAPQIGVGTAGGTVSVAGLTCASACLTTPIYPGTNVTLTATPLPGNHFSHWAGACSGTTATCTLPGLVEPAGVSAWFEAD